MPPRRKMQDHWSKVHQDMRAIYEEISEPEKGEKSSATSSGTEEQSKIRIREAIYKIRSLAKTQGKPISRSYQEYIANSSLTPNEKAKVKAKVMGTSEEYVYHMESLQFDEQTGHYKVRVTESNSGKIFVRTISLQKVHELRSMPDLYNFATEAKELDPVGQEDDDIDNDGDKNDKNDKYLKKRRKAIGKAIDTQKQDLEVHEDLMSATLDKMDEGYKELSRSKRNTMFRKAGNLSRDAISTPVTPENREKAHKRSGKIVKALNKDAERHDRNDVKEMIDPKGAARMDAAKKKNKVDVFAYDRKLQAQGKLKGRKLPPPPTNEEVEKVEESTVPGKPAERLGAVTAIPKDERDAAKKRLLAKAAAKRIKAKVDEAVYGGTPTEPKDTRMTVTNADKKGNTKAYQNYKGGDKRYKYVGEDIELPFGDMKAMVKRAIKRIDADVDGDVDEKDKTSSNEMGEFVPTPDGKKKTTRVKEGYSWRNDLIEVMGDELDAETKKKIDVMKGKNKININPKEEVDLSDSLEIVIEEEETGKKYCRLCKKKETKSQCGFGPKMWEKYSVNDASEKEVETAAEEGGISDGGDGGGVSESMSPQEMQVQRKQLQLNRLKIQNQQKALQGKKKSDVPVTSEETGAEYHDRMKKKVMPWKKPNTTRSNVTPEVKAKMDARKTSSKMPPKDNRSDARKMSDATGPRPGSRYRGD